MIDQSDPRAILLDIEGTVAPISFVHEVLFPYARSHLEAYLRRHWNDAGVAAVRAMLNKPPGDFSEQSLESLKATLFALMDADTKSTGLKQLQGLIWEEGYRAGHFQSPVFPDVPPALWRWKKAGMTIAIYSSGSVAAQRVFFQHTSHGDLTPYLSAFYDTTTGPKKSALSYQAIASALKMPSSNVVFVSDIPEELEAAGTAGLRGLLCVRPGNASVDTAQFDRITSFDQF